MNRKSLSKSCLSAGLLLITLIGWGMQGTAQEVESIRDQFVRYTEHALTEKIFLHTDRNFYIAGEIVWFKAYLVSHPDNRPAGSSRVAYVEVLDEENRPVLQEKIGMKDGAGKGSFYLSSEFPSGNYKLRAYTAWMKNFEAAFFFEKEITIVNTSSPLPLLPPDTSVMYDMQFFPEGGRLVRGVSSTVAFKLTDGKGKGVHSFHAVVVDTNNDTVAHLSPYRFGIGRFTMNPGVSGKYTAYITMPDGLQFQKELPLPDDNGYVMQLRATNSGAQVSVQVKGVQADYVYVLVHTRGIVKDARRLSLHNGYAQMPLDRSRLGDGVSHITIFDSQRRPVCERLYFSNIPDQLQIEAGVSQKVYGQRKKIAVSLRTADAGNLSMAVYRNDSLQNTEPFDINSYLWLSSELKGRVESPGWYFSAVPDSAGTALDNLMLTHGWRRFDWRNIRQGEPPAFNWLPEIDGHILTGKITAAGTGRALPGSLVFLSFPGAHAKFYTAESDKNGQLVFYTRDVYGRGELIAEMDNAGEQSYNIDIVSPFADAFSSEKVLNFQLTEDKADALTTSSIHAQIVRKFGEDRLKELMYPGVVDTSRFYGKPDESYLLDHYTRFTTMEEVLREYVVGIVVGRSGKNYRLRIIDPLSNTLLRDNPLVLLDGVPVLEMNRIIAYDPLKVKRLDVLRGNYYYGAAVFSGIADFITYKGNMEDYEMNPGAVVLDYDGLQLHREFYSPVYETTEEQQSKLADYRNLLYWNPDIAPGKNNTAEFIFYTGDVPGEYTGVVQGITEEGHCGSATFSFTVE